jgi:signal transduction histidine kinase
LANVVEERTRIARELHDAIAQDLAAIGYVLDAEIGRSDTSPESRKSLRLLREQVTTLNSKVRAEIFRLRSPIGSTPLDMLKEILETLEIEVDIQGELPESETGFELSKVLQELSRNAKDHGGASKISIILEPSLITITNNGVGEGSEPVTGYGLQGVSERLERIGWQTSHISGYSHVEIWQIS